MTRTRSRTGTTKPDPRAIIQTAIPQWIVSHYRDIANTLGTSTAASAMAASIVTCAIKDGASVVWPIASPFHGGTVHTISIPLDSAELAIISGFAAEAHMTKNTTIYRTLSQDGLGALTEDGCIEPQEPSQHPLFWCDAILLTQRHHPRDLATIRYMTRYILNQTTAAPRNGKVSAMCEAAHSQFTSIAWLNPSHKHFSHRVPILVGKLLAAHHSSQEIKDAMGITTTPTTTPTPQAAGVTV